MLSRRQRLTRERDIRRVLQRGTRLRTPHVNLHVLLRASGSFSRAACIVTKRVHAAAVHRHQYQRWLRAALQSLLPHLPQPYDVVVIGTPAMNRLRSSRGLREEIAGALRRHVV